MMQGTSGHNKSRFNVLATKKMERTTIQKCVGRTVLKGHKKENLLIGQAAFCVTVSILRAFCFISPDLCRQVRHWPPRWPQTKGSACTTDAAPFLRPNHPNPMWPWLGIICSIIPSTHFTWKSLSWCSPDACADHVVSRDHVTLKRQSLQTLVIQFLKPAC